MLNDGTPWWLALAPLLAFLFDALLGGLSRRRMLAEAVWRACDRLLLVMRRAPFSPQWAGTVLVLWVAGAAAFGAVALDVLGYAMFEHEGRLGARVAIVFLLLSTRRLVTAGLYVSAAVEAGNLPLASRWVEAMGGRADDTEGGEVVAVVGATIRRLGRGLLESAIVPLFWSALLGPGGGTFAVVTREIVRFGTRRAERGDPLFTFASRLDRGFADAAAWGAALSLDLCVRVLHNRDARALPTFIASQGLSPYDRVTVALAAGLGLGAAAGGPASGPAPSTQDVARTVVALWVTVAVVALGLAAIFGVLGTLA